MRAVLLIAVAIVAELVVGCGRSTPVPDKPTSDKPLSGAADLQARLTAAMAITGVSLRNTSLATVAVDASMAGEVELVKRAINEITDVQTKNDSAATAALKLAGKGKRAEAIDVADLITGVTLRNETLAKLAKAEPGE
jgi:hypothetical protein